MKLQSFKREERLKSRKIIAKLFESGNSFGQYPLRLIWTTIDPKRGDSPIKISVSVPKKKFAKASKRNRIRRQVKEAYRLHKSYAYEALEGESKQYAFMVLYVAKEALPYQEIEEAMKKMLNRFVKKVKFPSSTHNQN